MINVVLASLVLTKALLCQGLVIKIDFPALATQVSGVSLDYKVAFGDKESPFQMNDLHVKLSNIFRTNKPSSTGIYDAEILRYPYFINEKGEQEVELTGGGWEICWNTKSSSPHGLFICSFVCPRMLQRNEAMVEAGRFFVMHRVWTETSLESERNRRRKIQNQAAKSIKDRDGRIKEMTNEEATVGSKVLSYAKAVKSMNDYRTSGYREALFIPLFDEQVLKLAPDCIVSTRGQIYQEQKWGRKVFEYVGESRVDFLK